MSPNEQTKPSVPNADIGGRWQPRREDIDDPTSQLVWALGEGDDLLSFYDDPELGWVVEIGDNLDLPSRRVQVTPQDLRAMADAAGR